MVDKLADVGGIFALLVLIHFVADWVFQSHKTATRKSWHRGELAWHSMWYTLWFLVFLGLFPVMDPMEYMVFGLVLFLSHAAIDTYIPLTWWAKYLRQMPEPDNNPRHKGAWSASPVNPLLFITVDQIFHMLFLLPVAVMVVW